MKSKIAKGSSGLIKIDKCNQYSYKSFFNSKPKLRQFELNQHGRLSTNNGQDCMVRSLTNDAYMIKCSVGFEYIKMSPVLVFGGRT